MQVVVDTDTKLPRKKSIQGRRKTLHCFKYFHSCLEASVSLRAVICLQLTCRPRGSLKLRGVVIIDPDPQSVCQLKLCAVVIIDPDPQSVFQLNLRGVVIIDPDPQSVFQLKLCGVVIIDPDPQSVFQHCQEKTNIGKEKGERESPPAVYK